MKAKRKILILFVLLFIIGGAFALYAYPNYLLPRMESPWQTYQPFSGKLFAIDSAQAGEILVSSKTGRHRHRFSSPDDVEKILSHLNGFRYFFWIPEPKGEGAVPVGSSEYGSIRFGQGGFTFQRNRMLISASSQRVSGGHRKQVTNFVWYYGPKDFFNALEALRACDDACKEVSGAEALEKSLPPGWGQENSGNRQQQPH